MSLKRFVLGVEFYKAGNEEEPAFVNGGLTHLIDGSKITVLEVPEEIEATREFLLDFNNQAILATRFPRIFHCIESNQRRTCI